MLLAEELALVSHDPDSGRHGLGNRAQLNACMAGLLVAELLLEGAIGPGERADRLAIVDDWALSSPTLAAAAQVVAEKGPKMKAVLSHMNRGLEERVGLSTWDAAMLGLARAGIVGPVTGGLIPVSPSSTRAHATPSSPTCTPQRPPMAPSIPAPRWCSR